MLVDLKQNVKRNNKISGPHTRNTGLRLKPEKHFQNVLYKKQYLEFSSTLCHTRDGL